MISNAALEGLLLAKPTPAPAITAAWAAVTSADPLRLTLYGEDSESEARPRDLVGGLVVGDTVWTILHKRERVIVGRLGGPRNGGTPQ